jgi:hypothetical protein
MVLLTMTPAVVAAVTTHNKFRTAFRTAAPQQQEEPSLEDAKVGNPISHSQLIVISKFLKEHKDEVEGGRDNATPPPFHLCDLLRGCGIYIPPPPPKPETVYA